MWKCLVSVWGHSPKTWQNKLLVDTCIPGKIYTNIDDLGSRSMYFCWIKCVPHFKL